MQSPVAEAIDKFLKTEGNDDVAAGLAADSIEHPTKTFFSSSDVLEIYSDDEQFRQGLNKLRQQNIYTDVQLICRGYEFNAHKFILASGSDYFHDAFAQTTSPNVLVMHDIDPLVLEELIAFLYTGQINIAKLSAQKLSSVVKVGAKLRIYYIENSVLHYLIDNLNTINFGQALKLSLSLHDSLTENQIIKYLGDNIESVWTSSGFTHLPQNHLITVFQNIHQDLTSHDILLRAMLAWIGYKTEERRGCLSKFLHFVNFDKVSVSLASFLLQDDFVRFRDETKILRTELISKVGFNNTNIVNQTKLEATTTFVKSLTQKECSKNLSQNSFFEEKAEDGLAIIGRDHANRAVVVKYNFVQNFWGEIQDTGASLDIKPGIGYYQNRVYFVGGQDYGGKKLSQVSYFDLATSTSTALNPLCVPRAAPGVLGSNNSLLVVGGLGRFSRQGLSLTEQLDFNDPAMKWVPARQLRMKRGEGTRLMFVEGSVVITGGESTKCEYFDVKRNAWVLSQPLPGEIEYETVLYAVADDKLCAFKYFKPNCLYKLDMIRGEWVGTVIKGKPPEWAVSAVGWKSIIFVIDKAKSLFILDAVDYCWSLTSKLPKKIVYPVFIGI